MDRNDAAMPHTGGPATQRGQTVAPRRFVFLLLDGFPLLGFASAVEPLRFANRLLGRTAYAWRLLSETRLTGNDTVTSSDGIAVRVDGTLEQVERSDTVLVCAGQNVQENASRPVVAWLRREARRGAVFGGIGTGSWALARAGLLDGRRATTHWNNQDAFAEEFPEVALSRALFVIDGLRISAAGGTAATDLMLKLIAADHGEDLAQMVGEQIFHPQTRGEQETQRPGSRIGMRHPKLAQVIQMMERSMEEPVSPATLAEAAGMSTRQLERLFARHLNRSPKRFYMELRLQKARNLLLQTEMSVINVALACGFTSPSHFSKCYRAQFHTTPYRERSNQGVRLSI